MLVGITWLSPLSPPRLSYKGWLKQPSTGPAGTGTYLESCDTTLDGDHAE